MLSSMTKSKALFLFKFKAFSLVIAFFLSFSLIGCGGGGDSSSSNNSPDITYSVSFYDENLDLIEAIPVEQGNIDIADIKLGVWYKASENTPLATLNLNSDTALYAVANIVEITSQDELAFIKNNSATLEGKYILLNDIPLNENGAGFEDTLGWIPIGNNLYRFTGIFNGNGHKITNLWINRQSDYHIGLFGFANNAQIKNLGVEIAEGKSISGYSHVGGIVGYASNVNIINSYSKGNINGNDYVGGIVGNADYTNMANSYSTGNINGEWYIGGIAGEVSDTNMANSYSKVNINGNRYIGGIVGEAQYSNIINVYSTGNINGNYYYIGGIAGDIVSSSNISNSVAINSPVIGRGSGPVNRVVGYIYSGIVSNNFALDIMVGGENYNGLANSFSYSGDIRYHGIGRSIEELKTRNTYETGLGWKFGDNDTAPWKIDSNKNNGLPYFYWQD